MKIDKAHVLFYDCCQAEDGDKDMSTLQKTSYYGCFQLSASNRHCPCPAPISMVTGRLPSTCLHMTLHRLSFIVENIQLSVDVDFTIAIRLPTFDWCSAGTFHLGILPAGGTCIFDPTAVFSELDEMNVDMKVECQLGMYSATLNIAKAIGETEFFIHGSTVLFHEGGSQEVLLLSIILAADCIRSPMPFPMTSTESQTDTVKVREISSQALPRQQNQKVETYGRIVEEAALQEAVMRALQINMEKEKNKRQPTKQSLGWNIVPRLQKLSVLDQMISNRERLLEVLGSTVQHSEVRKKMEYIRSQRRPDKEWRLTEKDKREEISTKQGVIEEDVMESSDVMSDTSGSSRSQNTDDANQGSPESSNSSMKESPERQAAPPQKRAVSFSSSIEDPFSPRPQETKPAEKESGLSPTSEYIKTLREDILLQRMDK